MMHKTGYQHKVVKIIERMTLDAWREADKVYLVNGTNGEKLSLSMACKDIQAYQKLTDGVTDEILISEKEKYEAARVLLHRIQIRELYCYKKFKPIEAHKNEDVEGQFQKFIKESRINDQLGIIAIKIPEGKGNINPNVTFINEASEIVDATRFVKKIDVEQEKIKYIFYVKDSALEEEAKVIVEEFCKSNPSFDVIDF